MFEEFSSELVQNDSEAVCFGVGTLAKDAEADTPALGNVPLLQKIPFWSPASSLKPSKREGWGMSDTARSAAAMSLQHYVRINGEISCHCLGNKLKRRHLWCPWFKRSDMSQVTPQDCMGRGSNHRLTLMKEWKSTLLLPGHLAGSCIRAWGWGSQGFAMGKRTASGRRKEAPLREEFLPTTAHQLNDQGRKRKKFSAKQQRRWDQDLHLKYDLKSSAFIAAEAMNFMLSFNGWLVKNEATVFCKSNARHKYCFHVKSWWLLPI